MVTRAEIVAEGRTYIGTRFIHQGRKKQCGVDCIGLLTGIAQAFELTHHDRKSYDKYPTESILLPELEKTLEEIPIEEAQPGDILVFWISKRTKIPQHLGLMTDIGMIHTYQNLGKVVEHGLDIRWTRRLCHAFRFPGVE